MGRAAGGDDSWKFGARKAVANAVNKWLGRPRKVDVPSSAEDANVLVGPVIGKVTSTSARVLLEVDKPSHVTVILTQADDATTVDAGRGRNRRKKKKKKSGSRGGHEHSKLGKNVAGMRPCVFQFTGLVPGTKYRVELEGCRRSFLPGGSFCTFPAEEEKWEKMNVGVISCNKIFITQQAIPIHSDLWEHLANSIEDGKVDLLLHLGDQVYGDGDKMIDKEAGQDHDKWSNRFRLCEDLMKDVPKEQWHQKQELVCDKYRQVYRETWQHLPTARCLANCPNLMIFDDHEIRDNWADLERDWDPETPDFFIARCAWIVYLEYQRQLDRDIDFSNLSAIHKLSPSSSGINKDHHFHVVGGLGLMFLDVRGSRSFHRVEGDKYPYLGTPQWRDIENSLQPGGEFSRVRLLLVCSPAPLVFLEPRITNVAGKNVPRLVDFRGHWSADIHIQEQTKIIETLLNWKTAGRREVMILGGDVHCGGHSHILKDNKVIFNQITTSAIANRPLPKSVYYFMRGAGRLGNLGSDYRFRHHHWTRSRNYGLLQIRNYRQQDAGDVELVSQLVIGKFVGGIMFGEPISNTDISKIKCGCFEVTGMA